MKMSETMLKVKIPKEAKNLAPVSGINWQRVLEKRLQKDFRDLARFESIISKSKLTQKQADALANETNQALANRYEQLMKEK